MWSFLLEATGKLSALHGEGSWLGLCVSTELPPSPGPAPAREHPAPGLLQPDCLLPHPAPSTASSFAHLPAHQPAAVLPGES